MRETMPEEPPPATNSTYHLLHRRHQGERCLRNAHAYKSPFPRHAQSMNTPATASATTNTPGMQWRRANDHGATSHIQVTPMLVPRPLTVPPERPLIVVTSLDGEVQPHHFTPVSNAAVHLVILVPDESFVDSRSVGRARRENTRRGRCLRDLRLLHSETGIAHSKLVCCQCPPNSCAGRIVAGEGYHHTAHIFRSDPGVCFNTQSQISGRIRRVCVEAKNQFSPGSSNADVHCGGDNPFGFDSTYLGATLLPLFKFLQRSIVRTSVDHQNLKPSRNRSNAKTDSRRESMNRASFRQGRMMETYGDRSVLSVSRGWI